MLLVQNPVGFRDRINVQEPVLSALFAKLRDAREQSLPRDSTVDHDVGDMDTLWPKLARNALCQGPLRCLGGGEGRKIGFSAKATRSSRKEQRATAIAKQQGDRGLAQLKSTKGVFTPVLFEGGFAELEERRGHVAACILDGDRKRSQALGALDKASGVLCLGSIADDEFERRADLAELGRGRLDLCRASSSDRDRITSAQKASRDGSAQPLRCADADDKNATFFLCHAIAPAQGVEAQYRLAGTRGKRHRTGLCDISLPLRDARLLPGQLPFSAETAARDAHCEDAGVVNASAAKSCEALPILIIQCGCAQCASQELAVAPTAN